MNPYDNCPDCGYDLDGHAFKQAIAEAESKDGPDPPPNRVVFYWWPKTLTACPRCGVPAADFPEIAELPKALTVRLSLTVSRVPQFAGDSSFCSVGTANCPSSKCELA